MNPQDEIQARLENSMAQLRREFEAAGVDVNSIACEFEVYWHGGAIHINHLGKPTGDTSIVAQSLSHTPARQLDPPPKHKRASKETE